MTLLAKAGAIALAFCPASLASAVTPVTIHLHYPMVHQVKCDKGLGSAFRVGPTRFISVDHVTRNTGCTIDGQPFSAVAEDGLDFSVVEIPTLRRLGGLKINCGGFHRGDYVYASGYAYGRPWQQMVILRATGQHDGNLAVLYGAPSVIPGMSGGPVMNARGEVVGTINRYMPFFPYSFSQELKGTSVCKGKSNAQIPLA
jgi:hypothetical protein